MERIPRGDATGINSNTLASTLNTCNIVFIVFNTFKAAWILRSCWLILLIHPFLATLAWFIWSIVVAASIISFVLLTNSWRLALSDITLINSWVNKLEVVTTIVLVIFKANCLNFWLSAKDFNWFLKFFLSFTSFLNLAISSFNFL